MVDGPINTTFQVDQSQSLYQKRGWLCWTQKIRGFDYRKYSMNCIKKSLITLISTVQIS